MVAPAGRASAHKGHLLEWLHASVGLLLLDHLLECATLVRERHDVSVQAQLRLCILVLAHGARLANRVLDNTLQDVEDAGVHLLSECADHLQRALPIGSAVRRDARDHVVRQLVILQHLEEPRLDVVTRLLRVWEDLERQDLRLEPQLGAWR
eukprot:7385228-Prymnesium_polylepis.1